MQMHNLPTLNQQQSQTVRDSPWMSATENRLLVERHCQVSAVVGDSLHTNSYNISMTLQSFSMTFMTYDVIFHHFPRPENGLTKFHDSPWPGDTLHVSSYILHGKSPNLYLYLYKYFSNECEQQKCILSTIQVQVQVHSLLTPTSNECVPQQLPVLLSLLQHHLTWVSSILHIHTS